MLVNDDQARPLVICLGGANIDQKIRLDQAFVPGTSNPVTSTQTIGGVIRNVAANLAHLGLSVSLMTMLGQDRAGDEILADAEKSLQLGATERVADFPTGSYTAVLDPAGDLIAGFVDMAITQLMRDDWIERHRLHLEQADWLVADCNMQPSALRRLIELARQEPTPLAIVTISEPKMKHLPTDLSGVRLLVTNLAESRAYFEAASKEPRELARLWLERGVDQVVITQGKEAITYGSKAGIFQRPSVALSARVIIDVTGAGDAFSAAAIYGLIQGYSLDRAVSLGAGLAALTIQSEESVRRDITLAQLEGVI